MKQNRTNTKKQLSNKIKQRMLAGTALEWLGLNEQNYIH